MKRLPAILFCLFFLATHAFGWSTKEHVQLTRIAAMRLINDPSTPADMKAWLQSLYPQQMDMAAEKDFLLTAKLGAEPKGLTGISYFAIEPDIFANDRSKRDVKIEPYGVSERPMHFIDLEYFLPGEAKRAYRHDLSGKPKLEDFPRDMKDPRYTQGGFLPFRVQECYTELVKSIREKRLTETDDHNNAVKWAGYLAHYLEDNTQPQHSTIDYKSASYFGGNPNKAPNVHAEVEYKMIDDKDRDFMELRNEFWPLFEQAMKTFEDPIQTDDLFTATLQVSLQSYDALPLIGLAAMKATKNMGTPEAPHANFQPLDTEVFFRFKGPYKGKSASLMEMKAEQLAWAVKRVERVWKKAWEEGTK